MRSIGLSAFIAGPLLFLGFRLSAYGAPIAPLQLAVSVQEAQPLEVGASQLDLESIRLRLTDKMSPAALVTYTTTATWCGSCRKELPQFEMLEERFRDGSVQMYGVPVDPNDTKNKLANYRKKHNPRYELLPDCSDEQVLLLRQVIFRKLRVDGLPATVVTDTEGRILHVQGGVPSVSTLRRLLAQVAP